MIACYLGCVDEDEILNMSYPFFEDVLKELGYRLNYEAVVNYAGNSFCEKSGEMIEKSNPFRVQEGRSATSGAFDAFVQMLGKTKITRTRHLPPPTAAE